MGGDSDDEGTSGLKSQVLVSDLLAMDMHRQKKELAARAVSCCLFE
jgi:hypothetical protein